MSEIAVTDAHALIWYALGHRKKLGSSARAFFDRVDAGSAAAYVPALVLVEVLEAEQRGDIRLNGGGAEWMGRLLESGVFFEVPLTAAIVAEAQSLYGIPERRDRLIAATALHLGYPLITRDPDIAATGRLDLLW